MAKVTLGPIVTDARGKCGTTIFSRDRGGAYTRALPKKVNPKTAYQLAVRAQEKAIVQAWSTSLTDQQRLAWNALAREYLWRTKIGEPFALCGFTLYVKCALNLTHVGATPITDPPLSLPAIDCGPLTASASASTPQVLLYPANALPDNCAPLVMATKSLSPGINNFRTYRRQLYPLPQTTLYTDNFPGDTFPWGYTPYPNDNTLWTEANNTLSNTPTSTWANLAYGPSSWANYTATVTLTLGTNPSTYVGFGCCTNLSTGAGYLALVVGNPGTIYLLKLTAWQGYGGYSILASAPYSQTTAPQTWALTTNPPLTTLNINGTQVLSASDNTYQNGGICFSGLLGNGNWSSLNVQTIPIPLSLPDITANYLSKFTSLTAGKRIGFTLAYIHLPTGSKAPAQSTLITTGP
jgi:hypothetical protein